jgi:CheY-like chemotaxis protein
MHSTILIIEDEPIQQLLMEEVVKDLGYTPQICSDGKEGVDYIKHGIENIKAVLLDIYIPQIDGISVLGHFMSRHPDLPVLIVTGSDDEEDESVCLVLGAKKFIKKPFKPEELKKAIQDVIN